MDFKKGDILTNRSDTFLEGLIFSQLIELINT